MTNLEKQDFTNDSAKRTFFRGLTFNLFFRILDSEERGDQTSFHSSSEVVLEEGLEEGMV